MTHHCLYCGNGFSEMEEHLFPNGLGGEKVYVDFICPNCNVRLSNIETELLQKSPIALFRTLHTVQGYCKTGHRKSQLKYDEILSYVEVNDYVYEVGQYSGANTYIKPQLFVSENEYFVDGASEVEINSFLSLLNEWKQRSLKVKYLDGDIYKTCKFSIKNDKYSFDLVDLEKDKHNIYIKILSPLNEHYEYFTPRIYLDYEKRISVRSKSVSEAFLFIEKYLNTRIVAFKLFDSIPGSLNVGFKSSFDNIKTEQALMKIGLNVLFHFFPRTKSMENSRKYIDFVKDGVKSNIVAEVSDPLPFIDNNDDIHYVLLKQFNDFLIVRVSLFSSALIYSFWFDSANVISDNEPYIFEVNYRNRVNSYTKLSDRFTFKMKSNSPV